MAIHRKRAGRTFGWRLSAIFNLLLVAMPVMAAQILANARVAEAWRPEPTPPAIMETQKKIDRAFASLPPRGADRRDFWADLVARELGQRDLAAAEGYLLAAPAMLSPDDARALEAAAEDQPTGSAEDRLSRAAILFLPPDVASTYESALRPRVLSLASVAESRESDGAAIDGRPLERGEARFLLIGAPEDLAEKSRRWLVDGDADLLILRLAGLALVADQMQGPAGAMFRENGAQAASILKAARRAGRLHATYVERLSQRIETVMPERVLRTNLEAAIDPSAPANAQVEAVLNAYAASFAPADLARLAQDLQHVAKVQEATSAAGAVALMEHVRSLDDMRAARLVAEAGGARAIALVKQIGRDGLDVADSGARLNKSVAIQAMGLAALFMAFVWVVVSVVIRTFATSSLRAI